MCWASYIGPSPVDKAPSEFSAAEYPDERSAVAAITQRFDRSLYVAWPDILIIEEMPHGVAWGEGVKNTIRMQGRIIERMEQWGHKDKILFLQPMTWQSDLKMNRKTVTEQAAFAVTLGYAPPDLVKIHIDTYKNLHGKERAAVRGKLKKLMEDHVSAFLMYAWAVGKWGRDGTFDDIKGAQRYNR